MPALSANNRLCLLMHESIGTPQGKMGDGLIRYALSPTVVIVDRQQAGGNYQGIPIVAKVREAIPYGPDICIPAIAPSGGRIPEALREAWIGEMREAIAAGMSIASGLHESIAPYFPDLPPSQFVWDVRQEPPGLIPAAGRTRDLSAKRILFVGTDMNNGKMTAALELHKYAQSQGVRTAFLATGQIGILIAGSGIPLDAIRVDFAAGAVEELVLEGAKAPENAEMLFIEGQGSLLNPASTATLSLLRGSMPTHLILVHRAGQTEILRNPWAKIPPIPQVIALYEAVANASPSFPHCRVVGIALNTGHLESAEAARYCESIAAETNLPVADVLRDGAESLFNTLL
jgi:uncharacterized NAD-dependent epimerase/dehydratase family protein